MNAIEIKGLEKRYDGFQLGSFDLTLPSGCIMERMTIRETNCGTAIVMDRQPRHRAL